MAAFFHHGNSTRAHHNVFAPAVNHGKAQFGVFADIHFADADMHAVFNFMC